MRPEVISIIVLVAIFVLATVRSVNLGALGFVAAFGVGTFSVGLAADELLAGFPSAIFVILVGLTYLFGIAQLNGTLDLLVHWFTKLVRGRTAAMPWIFFVIAGALMSIGAVFSVAIVAPLAMSCARRHNINPLLMGMLVVHGALSTAFSPISVYGSFVNEVVADADITASPGLLFVAPLILNTAIAAGVYVALRQRTPVASHPEYALASDEAGAGVLGGGRGTTAREAGEASPRSEVDAASTTTSTIGVTTERAVTLVGLAVLAFGTVAFNLDVGFLSLSIATVISFAYPQRTNGAVAKVNWSTVLLICGVLTYVGTLEEAGTIDYASDAILGIGLPIVAALLLCYLGGITSAFASSLGILAVIIPLAVPFLKEGNVSAIGMVAALAFAATVVDVSPFSTNGALVLANTAEEHRPTIYRQMLRYSALVVVAAPPLAWAVLVASGWF